MASSPAPSGEPKGWTGGDISKRKWATDKVDIKRTGSSTRDACVGLMYDGLAFMSEESTSRVIIKAIEIERAAFTHFKGDNSEYRSKMRSLFQNLKNKTNRELGPRVMSGDITPDKFVVMTHKELQSQDMKEIEEKLSKENMKNAQVPMAEKSISDALKCGKCGQKKVSYSQAQTRSADEPMTTFCECTVCGNRWKVRWILNTRVCVLTLPVLLMSYHACRYARAYFWLVLWTNSFLRPSRGPLSDGLW